MVGSQYRKSGTALIVVPLAEILLFSARVHVSLVWRLARVCERH